MVIESDGGYIENRARCVRGHAGELKHMRGQELPEQMEVHLDLAFPGDGDDRRHWILWIGLVPYYVGWNR